MFDDDTVLNFNEITKNNVNSLCRVCLQDGVLKSVFAEDEIPKLCQKINECASVQIESGDGLPENICDYCITELNLAYNFKKQCESSELKLRRFLNLFTPPCESKEDRVVDTNDNIQNDKEEDVENGIIENDVKEYLDKGTSTNDGPFFEFQSVIGEPIVPIEIIQPVETVNGETQTDVDFDDPIKSEVVTESRKSPKCLRRQGRRSRAQTLEETQTPPRVDTSVVSSSENDEKKVDTDDPNDKKFKCKRCDKRFSIPSRLKLHEVIHKKARPYKCEVCKCSFKRKDIMRTHEKTHLKLKPFKCDDCDANFTKKSSLIKHQYVHTKIKQFQCPHCSKMYGRYDNFQIHVKVHTGQKSYKCDLCTKAFMRSDVLQRHKLTHLRSKKFECTVCLKSYSRPDVLRIHMKRHVEHAAQQKIWKNSIN